MSTYTTSRSYSKRSTKRLNRKKRRNNHFGLILVIVLILSVATIGFKVVSTFIETHFWDNTTINNVDCSWLTPEEAAEKVNAELASENISFVFLDSSFVCSAESLNLKVATPAKLNEFLTLQNENIDNKTFTTNSFSINEKSLKSYLKSIPSLDQNQMTYPENAYVTLSDENRLVIIPEIFGNVIDFDEAYNLAKTQILSGSKEINFSDITLHNPEIISKDLEENVNRINNILSTTITFEISKDLELKLDSSVMKDWLIQDENGSYVDIDIDSNLPNFVNLLEETVSNETVYFEFEATDIGTVRVPAKNLTLNKEAEIHRIKTELENGNSCTITPLYNISIGNTYIELDIARQHLWVYINGVCVLESDCVTGMAGKHDTNEGYFFLTGKYTNKNLHGYNDDGSEYNSFVNYFMPFDGGIGFHDADRWRSAYGGTYYLNHGSHGCVNMPLEKARQLFNYITFDMPIIVYCSSK